MLWLFPVALAVDPPSFDVERGLYDAPFEVEFSTSDGADTVFYTFGPGVPDQLVTGPVTVESTSILSAHVVASDGATSPVVTHTYLFLDQVLSSTVMDPAIVADPVYGPAVERTLVDLPSLSVLSEGGVDQTEREVSFEWIDPDGDSLGVRCGAKKVGNASVTYDKFNLRLYFRSTYGPSRLEADLFAGFETGLPAADQHDALNLRSGSHDSVFYLGVQAQYLRNRWMDETQLEMGHVNAHGRNAHLYINGLYHGVFHVRERFNAAFMAEYFGGEEEDYETMNGDNIVDGDGNTWGKVIATSGSYEEVQSWLNVENLLDYMILNYYAANAWDWLYWHNWMAAGPVEPDRGGYIFHSNDSDICLVYDHTTNILHLGGPDNVFFNLLAEEHPDFLILLADRLQASLGPGGVLSPEAAADRYERLAVGIEDAMAAETARWGSGWWERDVEWATERARLMENFFPRRTISLLDQVREVGWLTMPAPELDVPVGLTPPESTGEARVPEGMDAELWVRLDGGDPREPGGEVAVEALGPDPDQALVFSHSAEVRARLRLGDQWGPLAEAWVEVDEPPPLVLNEWNAVDGESRLEEGDEALGNLPGNGGDWLEFVVIEDGLDLRGWRLTFSDRAGDAGQVIFFDHALLADLPSGTLFTVAEEMPEDTRFDPEGGDWRFHLRAGTEGSGQVVSATPFEVSHREWQLVVRDAEGWVRFGPVGEGVSPLDGISSREVGMLATTPGPAVRRDSGDYIDSDTSSFGEPNAWDDVRQDLDILRALGDPPGREDTADTGSSPDTGQLTSEGCGCAASPGPAGALAWWAVLGLWWRRRAGWLVLFGTGCTGGGTIIETGTEAEETCHPDMDGDGFGAIGSEPETCDGTNVGNAEDCNDEDPWTSPLGTEVCGGGDEDCDGLVDDDDPGVVDPLPFFLDGDADGHGSSPTTACELGPGLSLSGGDCDDDDPTIHPEATELCDDIDQDCDGIAEDALGASQECPLQDCQEALEVMGVGADGAYWQTLASGDVAQVWCDLTTEGGGWGLGFLRSSAGQGNQGTFGVGEVALVALEVSPEQASGDSTARMGWIDLNETGWTELQVSSAYLGAETFRSEIIPRAHLRLAFGEPGYLLYGGDSPYYWCGGPASFTDSGLGQVDQPTGAYADCKGHGSLGSGWDFSWSPYANQGLSLCGSDGSAVMHGEWAGPWVYYGTPGAVQAIWVR